MIPNSKFQILNSKNGFTLLELIISIAIITTLIGIFLANYHGGNKRTELIMIAQKMVTDIRLAQNNTLGSVKYGDDIPAGGWGVHFNLYENDSGYLIFADLDEDSAYDSGEGNEDNGARLINFPDYIKIESISVGLGQRVDIVFVPPDPVTIINYGPGTSSEVTITLKEDVQGSTKDIYVNFFGLIEAID